MFNYKIFDELPDFLTPDTLIKLGLYSNRDALYFARQRGKGPDFVQFGRRILYPKKDILNFLEQHSYKGNVPHTHNSNKNDS